jgi:hypothetical protein
LLARRVEKPGGRGGAAGGHDTTRLHFAAITEKVDLAERRTDVDAVEEQRCTRVAEPGKTIDWQEMRGCLQAWIAHKPVREAGVVGRSDVSGDSRRRVAAARDGRRKVADEKADPRVTAWQSQVNLARCFVSGVTLMELEFGVLRMDAAIPRRDTCRGGGWSGKWRWSLRASCHIRDFVTREGGCGKWKKGTR